MRVDCHSVGPLDDRIIQDDIKLYLHSELTRTTKVPTEERPLLLLKVIIAHEQTAIGVSWHHTLGTAPHNAHAITAD